MSKREWEGRILGRWSVNESCGEGGNGVVYRATRGQEVGAIKVLRTGLWKGTRYSRFKAEIEGMKRAKDIPGVIPLLDFNLPDVPTTADPPWIVMGFAECLRDALGSNATLGQIVEACADIAETLAAMHARGLAHRDIKPGNLFKFHGRWCVGDFGLVDYEGKAPVTAEGEKLGPLYYLAPEMLNDSATAHGQPADVYSLGKTLWVLATGQRYPLPGEMRRTERALTISAYVHDTRATLLDPLVEAATSFDPAKRPTMNLVGRDLRAWLRQPESPSATDELDLSSVTREIEGINQRHYVMEHQIREEHDYVRREGLRIRELFRPVVEAVRAALQEAHLLNAGASIDNHQAGFEVRGHILATAWPGEVELKLKGWIYAKPDGQIRVKCGYLAQVNEDGRTTDWELWEEEVSFLAGGSEEPQELGRLISDIRKELLGCVERVLRMSKGEEGAPPRRSTA